LGLPFVIAAVGAGYLSWPRLPELLPVSFPGVKTSRDDFLISIDREPLERRLGEYFDAKVTNEEIRSRYPAVMAKAGDFDPIATRETLRQRGMLPRNIVRYTYRPFDVRWLYWEPEAKLLDRNRAEYWPHAIATNRFLEAREKQPKENFTRGTVASGLADNFGNGLSNFFPCRLHGGGGSGMNLPQVLETLLASRKLPPETVFDHIVAIAHAPAYRLENAGALRMDWPRIPLPGDANLLRASSALGATLATLLDPETAAPGVSAGTLRAGLKTLGLPTRRGGKGLDADDLKLAARWGSIQNSGSGRIVMPGPGLVRERAYTDAERAALAAEGKPRDLSLDQVMALLGDTTFDIHLNADAWWSNVPARVWNYTLGGYQVVKKWLSYREHDVLGRPLKPDEAAYVSEMIRRIAAILLMGPALDKRYAESKAAAVEWKDGAPVES
jgi:hypothetical protein